MGKYPKGCGWFYFGQVNREVSCLHLYSCQWLGTDASSAAQTTRGEGHQ